jgi:hypothetical protein
MIGEGTNRDRLADGVIAVAIVGAAWWTFALPAHEREAEADGRAAEANMVLESAVDADAPDPVRVQAVRDRVREWSDAIDDTLGAGARLQRAADGAGVRIDRLAPAMDQEFAARGRLTTSTRRFEVVASGTAQAVGAMLDRISFDPLAIVRSFEMVPGAGADEVVAVIVIETIGIAIAEMQDPEVDQ